VEDFRYEIISGTPIKDIRKFFLSQCDCKGEEEFRGVGWRVKLIEQKPKIHGVILIPRTRIVFQGDEKSCEKIIGSFRMRFLSAGG